MSQQERVHLVPNPILTAAVVYHTSKTISYYDNLIAKVAVRVPHDADDFGPSLQDRAHPFLASLYRQGGYGLLLVH